MSAAPEPDNDTFAPAKTVSVAEVGKLLAFGLTVLVSACGGGSETSRSLAQPQPPVQQPAPPSPPEPQPVPPAPQPIPPAVPEPQPVPPVPQPVPPAPQPEPPPLPPVPPVSGPGEQKPVFRADALIDVASGPWIILGSSTAAGSGAPEGKGWASIIASRYAAAGANVVNLAKPGSVSYQGLSATRAATPGRPVYDPAANIDAALSYRPRVVFLAYPTNDTVSGYAVDETVNNLLEMRDMALARGAQVIVLSTQPRNIEADKRNKLQEINARLQGVLTRCFVNVHTPLADKDGRLLGIYDSGDGTHPNAQGHLLISTMIQWLVDSNSCVRIQK